MSNWLQKRLAVWMGAALLGGALVGNVGASRAQNNVSTHRPMGIETPRVPLSRDEAARDFAQLLQLFDEKAQHSQNTGEPGAEIMSSFSLKSERELGDAVFVLIIKMADQWQQPPSGVEVKNKGANRAPTGVGKQPQPVKRPFVLIQEGNSWGIDVFETYARWNGLEGAAKTVALAAALNRAKENTSRSSCQWNMKQVSLALLQYAQDYDEKLPLARNWIDASVPYSDERVFHCPLVTGSKNYGYAFNSKLSGQLQSKIALPNATIWLYETSTLKRNAYGTGENLAFRHLSGANYAFADGHVKWFPKTSTPSFKLKP